MFKNSEMREMLQEINEFIKAENHYKQYLQIYTSNKFYFNMINKLKRDGYNFDRL